ncbi:MAG: hypothetical protein AUH25_05760 [Thaumarchaeota archaeon 13_1_40CM_38_12]|nr:MAG: hypothetical protein AUH25_05760 [Thaumarchaeota archaeon 13_1_40CM_38_12]
MDQRYKRDFKPFLIQINQNSCIKQNIQVMCISKLSIKFVPQKSPYALRSLRKSFLFALITDKKFIGRQSPLT